MLKSSNDEELFQNKTSGDFLAACYFTGDRQRVSINSWDKSLTTRLRSEHTLAGAFTRKELLY
jgi:hypothetical protein